MTLIDYSILAVVGVGAGFINVIAGGGSMLSVPALLFLDVPGPMANGTNRIAIIAQALAATATFFRRGVKNLKLSITLSLAMMPGAAIGAWWGTHIEGIWFNRLLAGVMIAVMLTMGLESRLKRAQDSGDGSLKRVALVHGLMFVVGFYGGVIHIGIGFLIMFVLHRVGELSLVETNMHKMATVIPYSVAALAIFAAESGVLWIAGLALALGNTLGGWLGAHVSVSRGEIFIKRVFMLCIIALIIRLLLWP